MHAIAHAHIARAVAVATGMIARPRLLVTGATGTVGSRLLVELRERADVRVLATTRRPAEVSAERPFFDLTDPERSAAALAAADAAFLLLPPGLPDAPSRFRETLDAVPDERLPHVTFMSVQGADSRGFLPHAKIETVIRERYGRALRKRFTLLRPSYFMQNLETAFGEDLRRGRALVAPAGDAKFVWVDAADIARAAAAVLIAPQRHGGLAYAITGVDVAGFAEAAQLISEAYGTPVRYESPNPVSYYRRLRRRGKARGMALAQAGIHFAERFTSVAEVSADYTGLTGRAPVRLAEYVQGAGLL